VLTDVVRAEAPARVRLVQGSHIVVPRLYEHERCYIFQNADNRIVFAIPYERDFTLIGTTDRDYTGDPAAVAATQEEIAYLCAAAGEYFRRPVAAADVVWSYSGVRPLYDDGASRAQEATRDYVLHLDAAEGRPALLSIYGGKITTYRRLAEAALEKLSEHLPAGRRPAWTATAPLPGGEFPVQGYEDLVAATLARHPYLPRRLAARLVRAYGTKVDRLLAGAASTADLGQVFGADLTEAEVRYLIAEEWATRADDVLWRRSKLGLRLSPAETTALEAFMQTASARRSAPSATGRSGA
jgi:glycerol-3-phosphate dehydrogenase